MYRMYLTWEKINLSAWTDRAQNDSLLLLCTAVFLDFKLPRLELVDKDNEFEWREQGTWHLFILSYSLVFVIFQNPRPLNALNFYSADSAMIFFLLVKPPTHGWSFLRGFKGESVKFK